MSPTLWPEIFFCITDFFEFLPLIVVQIMEKIKNGPRGKGGCVFLKVVFLLPMQNSWNTLAAYSLLQFWLDPVIEYSVFYIFRKLSTEIQQSGAFNRISFPS